MVTDRSPAAAAVLLAAGSGTRMKADRNKAYLMLAGSCMVSWSLRAIRDTPEVSRTLLVVRPDDRSNAEAILESDVPGMPVELVDGGDTRHQSEYRALEYLAAAIEDGSIDVVLLHDAARPLAGPALMSRAIEVARESGGAIPGLEAHDLVRMDSDGTLGMLPSDVRYVRVQTPQAFRAAPLLDAYRRAATEQFEGTDTSASVERFTDIGVRSFDGDPRNLKVTYSQDLFLAERLLAASDRRE